MKQVFLGLTLIVLCVGLFAFTIKIQTVRAADLPVYYSVEPVPVAPLTDLNGSINGLETPSTPSPVGDNFTVEIHLRNANATNVPMGVQGVEVDFYFRNILNYCRPIGFADELGQTGGVLVGQVNYTLKGFYNDNSSLIASPPYTNATQYMVAANSTTGPWNGDDGLIAEITFQITGQPSRPQSDFYASLQMTYTLVNDGNGTIVPSDVIQGSLHIDASPQTHLAGTIIVPDDYSTIQAAINAANSGDTIYVRNGVYPEHVEVNKTVTLTGQSNQNTTIEAHVVGQSRSGVDITANNTILENFRIVPPNSTDPTEIPTLVFIDGRAAACSNNRVINCVFEFPTDVEAGSDAIDVYGSPNNTVTGNLITIADKTDAGIAVIVDSDGNLVDNNTITGGWVSVMINLDDNNTVSNNYLSNQTLTGGFSDIGALAIVGSSDDIIKGNTLNNDSLGLSVSEAYCSVYHNNFLNNTQQVLIESGSEIAFDNGYPSGGNYWSNYTGVDKQSGPYQNLTGSDGIGDTPYRIDANNTDNYPLMLLPSVFEAGTWNGTSTNISVVSNSTILGFDIDASLKIVIFRVSVPEGAAAFCMITIPNTIVQSLWPNSSYTVLLDGQPLPFRNWTDTTNTYIYANYAYSPQLIVIVPEFPSFLILALFMATTPIAIIIYKKTKEDKTRKD